VRRVVVFGAPGGEVLVGAPAREPSGTPAREPSAASRGLGPKTLRQLGHEHAALLIAEALRKYGGKKLQAARYLGVSRVTLWRRISRYGLPAGKE
jgi:DNA-binding NtrC family response regulator